MHVLATRPQSQKPRQKEATNKGLFRCGFCIICSLEQNDINFESQSVDEIWIFGGQHKISEIILPKNRNENRREFIMKYHGLIK